MQLCDGFAAGPRCDLRKCFVASYVLWLNGRRWLTRPRWPSRARVPAEKLGISLQRSG